MNRNSSTALGTLLLVVVGEQEPLVADVASRLRRDGYHVHLLEGADEARLHTALAQIAALDVLVTITPTKRSNLVFDDIGDDDFGKALQDQLLDVVSIAQAALARLRPGGRIIHVGSRGYQGAWGGAHQMAASAALLAMTRSMALELEPEGFCVNFVATEFSDERTDTERNRQAVAHAVSLFAAPDAGITGQHLVIDSLNSLRMSEARRPPAARH